MLRVYQIQDQVHVLGPGRRFAVWMQGCPFSCAGCCAPDSQSFDGGRLIGVRQLLQQVLVQRDRIEGVTVSGGEPFAQADALSEFLELLHLHAEELTVMVFSGYTLEHLRGLANASIERILERTDLLVDGLYREPLATDGTWTATANQRVHYLSGRYDERDQARSRRSLELFSDPQTGSMFLAGIPGGKN